MITAGETLNAHCGGERISDVPESVLPLMLTLRWKAKGPGPLNTSEIFTLLNEEFSLPPHFK